MGSLVVRIGIIVLNGIAGAIAGLSRVEPARTFFEDQHYRYVPLVAIGWLTLWGVGDGSRHAVVAHRERRREWRRKAKTTLINQLPEIVRASGVEDFTRVGLHVFVVAKRWRLRGWPLRYPVQEHVVRVRLGDYRAPSDITYEQGKGLVGRCWTEKKYQRRNLARSLRNYRTASREVWDALSPETRFGLTYDEFVNTSDELGAIFAAPIVTEDRRYIGCVTLDAPPEYFARLNTPQVKHLLEVAANAVRTLAPH